MLLSFFLSFFLSYVNCCPFLFSPRRGSTISTTIYYRIKKGAFISSVWNWVVYLVYWWPTHCCIVFSMLKGFMDIGTSEAMQEAYGRGVSKIGSSPPSCEHKCYGCVPCEAIQVPSTSTRRSHLGIQYANYEPESWKCKCGPSFYSPWTLFIYAKYCWYNVMTCYHLSSSYIISLCSL